MLKSQEEREGTRQGLGGSHRTPPGGGAQSLVVVGDHQLHPAQSAIGKS
jgi:hypothetical protein